ATNSTAAAAGTGATLSDGGSYYLMEDSSGRYQLEDASGLYLLDAYAYRNLTVKVSQNQDGTSTTYGSLETYQSGYSAGLTFLLVSNNLGIASNYTITNVRTTFEGAATGLIPVYTIEFGDAYQTLQTAGGGVLTRTGSQATQQLGVAMPGGTLGVATVTADSSTFTALTDVTVAAGRRIYVSAQCQIASSTAGDRGTVGLYEGATALLTAVYELADANLNYGNPIGVPLQPSAGVHTYKVSAARDSGAGNITAKASATNPAWIMIEDRGT